MAQVKQHQGMMWWGGLAGVAILVAVLAGSSPVAALTFIVDSTGDGSDVKLGDGICDAARPPDVLRCTLRAAVEEANTTDQMDVIQFSSGLDRILVRGSLVIKQNLIIQGQSDRRQHINGFRSTDGIFDVQGGIVRFEYVILEEGKKTVGHGGCLRIGRGADIVEVSQVNFINCEALLGIGGAIANDTNPLRVLSGAFIGNIAKEGGAIFTRSHGKTVVRKGTLFRENTAESGDGGAIANVGAGIQDIKDAQFVGNSAEGSGGGVAHQGRLHSLTKVVASRFADNVADFGGALCNVFGAGRFELENNTNAGGNRGFADFSGFQDFLCFAP